MNMCDKCIHDEVCGIEGNHEEAITHCADMIPKPKTGHWSHDGSHWKNRFICSECGYKLFDEPTNYCPNCGASMVEPQESEEIDREEIAALLARESEEQDADCN